MRRPAPLFLTLLALTLSGCAYRLGPTNGERAGTRSVQIEPFENKTIMPQLPDVIGHAMRKQMMRDGTYTLESNGDSDIVVTGVIVNYDRKTTALQPRDALSPRNYSLIITARVIARERVGGKVLIDRNVKGHSDIRIGADLASAEREAMPLVAEDFARNATALLVDGTW